MRKYLEPRKQIEISLPESLKAQLDIICLDPVRGKPDYGKRSEFIQLLLIKNFQERGLPISDAATEVKRKVP